MGFYFILLNVEIKVEWVIRLQITWTACRSILTAYGIEGIKGKEKDRIRIDQLLEPLNNFTEGNSNMLTVE